MFTRRWLAGWSASGLLFGCTTPFGSPAKPQGAAIASEAPSVTAADLFADGWDATVLDALRRYRPLFLRSRGVVPMVTIDGAPPANLSILETLTVSAICDVRLLRASTSREFVALTSASGVVSGDVLYVRMRTARRACSRA